MKKPKTKGDATLEIDQAAVEARVLAGETWGAGVDSLLDDVPIGQEDKRVASIVRLVFDGKLAPNCNGLVVFAGKYRKRYMSGRITPEEIARTLQRVCYRLEVLLRRVPEIAKNPYAEGTMADHLAETQRLIVALYRKANRQAQKSKENI